MKPFLLSRPVLLLSLWAARALAEEAPAPVHPAGIEKAVPSGVIEGGWGYVYAAYTVALAGLVFYALSLWTRRPGAQPPPPGDTP
ncbi:MAG: hypothetical protein IT380_14335 [Myxococcales bacterium]|nr:hypothetical protein [Myxococcales bacterium]